VFWVRIRRWVRWAHGNTWRPV